MMFQPEKVYLQKKMLSSLFLYIKEGYDHPKGAKNWPLPGANTNRLQNYMSGSRFPKYRSFHAEATPFLKQWIADNTLSIQDHLYFQACFRSDKTVLITVSYNKILGSRWLKIVSLKTFNRFIEKTKDAVETP